MSLHLELSAMEKLSEHSLWLIWECLSGSQRRVFRCIWFIANKLASLGELIFFPAKSLTSMEWFWVKLQHQERIDRAVQKMPTNKEGISVCTIYSKQASKLVQAVSFTPATLHKWKLPGLYPRPRTCFLLFPSNTDGNIPKIPAIQTTSKGQSWVRKILTEGIGTVMQRKPMDKNRKKYQVKLESELLTSAPHHKGICVVGGVQGKQSAPKTRAFVLITYIFWRMGYSWKKTPQSIVHTCVCLQTLLWPLLELLVSKLDDMHVLYTLHTVWYTCMPKDTNIYNTTDAQMLNLAISNPHQLFVETHTQTTRCLFSHCQ